MKDLYEKSGLLFSHLTKVRSLQVTAKLRATSALSSAEAGLELAIDAAATGEATLKLLAADAGKLESVKSVEIVSVSIGTITASGQINGDGDLEIALDSNQDLTGQDVDAEIRITYKLK